MPRKKQVEKREYQDQRLKSNKLKNSNVKLLRTCKLNWKKPRKTGSYNYITASNFARNAVSTSQATILKLRVITAELTNQGIAEGRAACA